MDRVYLALAALVGGILVGLAGWWDSKEGFSGLSLRKLGASAIRSLIAGVGFAAAYKLSGPLTALDLLWAFLAGTAFDAGVNRVAGALGNGQFPLPPANKKPPQAEGPEVPKEG